MKTEWKEDLFLASELVSQKLSKDYSDVTPMTDILLISAEIIDP